MNYIQLLASDAGAEKQELLIALLAEKGFEGFEETETGLKAFIRESAFNEDEVNKIFDLVGISYTIALIAPQNWNDEWERSFEPILVNDFVAIRAGFHQPVPGVRHEIVITPKMSFGTGHHATTYMMIQQMEELDFTGKTVLDFGTGTAVLAILAEKMGAIAADALDYDEWSIENAVENITANHCSHINPIKTDRITTNKQYDIILANINLNVILDHLNAIKAAAGDHCHILLSGFMKTDEPVLMPALTQAGMSLVKILHKGDWLCMHVITL